MNINTDKQNTTKEHKPVNMVLLELLAMARSSEEFRNLADKFSPAVVFCITMILTGRFLLLT